MTLGPTRQTNVQWLLAEYARTGRLPSISGGSGEGEHDGNEGNQDGGGTDGKNANEGKPKITFTDEQQAEINRIVAREAKAARDKAITAEQARIKAEQDAAEEDRKRKDAEAKGEYEKVKDSLTKERDTLKADFDGLKGEAEALKTYFTGVYDAAKKELPEAILAFAPADDASFVEKSAWLAKAQEQAAKLGGTTNRGNGPNPKPGNGSKINEAQEVAKVRSKVRM